MSTISFGGLATGLDTGSLIEELMAVERQPLTLLESDKTRLNNRLASFQAFEVHLQNFYTSVKDLGSSEQISARQVTVSSEGFFSATASADAPLAKYQVEVVSLAQVQKGVSQGYADRTAQDFGTGHLSLSLGDDEPVTIEITGENNSLEGIMEAINGAGAGVSASIINDGTESPYRLVLTGDNVASDFTLDASGLTGGAYELPVFTTTQAASEAHIRVDNVDIYSASNTLDEAIPGVTLDLAEAEEGTLTSLGVSLDKTAVMDKMSSFVSGYNAVMSFITGQSTMGDSEGGVLAGDAGLNTVKRRLQNMVSEQIDNSGNFTSLTELGLETQKDGTLKLNKEVFYNAVNTDFASVGKILAGEEGVQGIGARFNAYLENLTDSKTGFLAGREESINRNIDRIEDRILTMEMRLDKREENLNRQFTALEMLVSELNATGDYLTKQMESLENLWNYNK